MAILPRATTTIDDQSGSVSTGTSLLTIIFPCAKNADGVPRLYSSAAALRENHGFCDGLE